MVKVSELMKIREAVDFSDKQYHILTFVEDRPREVITRMGRRQVITVLENKQEKSLWLSHRGLQVIIEQLLKKHESLKGVKVKIKQLEKLRRMYDYEFEEI